ncbi:MAG: hypothetical protein ACI9F2_000753 [Lysobacterales bacterium]|jgi:hypothetical protein
MELISIENIDRDFLRAHFDQAYFTTGLDDKGSLFVQDKFKVYLDIGKKKQNITFSVYFNIDNESSKDVIQQLVEVINSGLMQVKAISSEDIVTIEYDLWIEGGVAPKNVVLAFRSFVSQISASLAKDEKRVLL